MTGPRFGRLWWIAILLAVLGSVIALINEWLAYRRSATVDWAHVVLAVGVPILFYAIARSASGRRS